MSCHTYDVELGDYVDGMRSRDGIHVADAGFAAFERHLAGCERCQALVADFRNIRETAATLPEQQLPPRLWATLSASVADGGRAPRRPAVTFSIWMPIAASLVVLVGAAGWLASRSGQTVGSESAAQALQGGAGLQAEQRYEEAIAGLQQIAEAQNTVLDPETRAIVQRNLAVIDRAITESRAALATEPASMLAQESLFDALDVKVALLQDTVALANEVE